MRTHIISTGIIAFVIASSVANAAPAPTIPITKNQTVIEKPEHPDLVLLRKQMNAHPELPPIDFWFAVAWCETRHHWDRGWDWGPNARSYVSGGLGIANTTWKGYGGKRFGKKAAFASMYAQIIIANRVGFLGHQTKEFLTWQDRANNRPFYRPAAGFSQGWGGTCRKAWVRKNGRP